MPSQLAIRTAKNYFRVNIKCGMVKSSSESNKICPHDLDNGMCKLKNVELSTFLFPFATCWISTSYGTSLSLSVPPVCSLSLYFRTHLLEMWRRWPLPAFPPANYKKNNSADAKETLHYSLRNPRSLLENRLLPRENNILQSSKCSDNSLLYTQVSPKCSFFSREKCQGL